MVLNAGHILRPIILPVPTEVRQWQPREKVEFLSLHARKALALSALKSGIELGVLTKNADGAPVPSNGHYWSLTHKAWYVAAVVSHQPVGIDIEEIRPVHDGLHHRVAGEAEWGLASGNTEEEKMFFRFWTAKEAVMKAAGTGIKDLSRIKIRQIPDNENLVLAFRENTWNVQQYTYDNHIAAIAAEQINIEWSIG